MTHRLAWPCPPAPESPGRAVHVSAGNRIDGGSTRKLRTMALLPSIQIQGFRCFEDLAAEGFSRVNVIVGPNNAGKTALLEAVEQLETGGSVVLLAKGLERRGAWVVVPAVGDEFVRGFDVSQLFHGSRVGLEGREFSLVAEPKRVTVWAPGANDGGLLSTQHWYDGREGQRSTMRVRPIDHIARQSDVNEANDLTAFLPGRGSVLFVGSGGVRSETFRSIWREIDGNPQAEVVTQALSILDSRIVGVAAPGSPSPSRGWEGVFVRLSGERDRVPVSRFGEGTTRLLGLGVALASVAGGTLLIDEIENGIHYSLHPRLWRFLVEVAKQLDVQVFVTTHSKDVMEAIGDLHREAPELAAEVSVHRLDPGAKSTVKYTAERIHELYVEGSEAR